MRLLLVAPFALLFAVGCQKTSSAPALATAAEKPKAETDLSRTTLPEKSAASLGIVSENTVNQPVQEQMPFTGWVMAKQGHEVTLTAPVAGYVRDAGGSRPAPVAGQSVESNQELFSVEPVLSAVEQVQMASLKRSVENEFVKAKESVTVAEKELRRVQELANQKLRGEQDLEQAQARLHQAVEDQAAANDKRSLFNGSGEYATFKPLPVRTPISGTILTIHASPGQYVQAAAPLITVADLSVLWVRVPVPEHYLPKVNGNHQANVTLKTTAAKGTPSISAKPISFVPQVDIVRHTADLLYELVMPKPAAAASKPLPLAKDQMVTVHVPLGGKRDETVVPYEAVVFDAYAGAWVYVDLSKADGDRVYERRRVELGPRVELPAGTYKQHRDGVVIRPGIKKDEKVVTAGAAALFSREFYKTPISVAASPPDVDDDD